MRSVYEIDRQKRVLEGGGRIVQETRLWDSARKETVSMRSKEEAHDYRYFPDPDLPRARHRRRRVQQKLKDALPETPAMLRRPPQGRVTVFGLRGRAAHDRRARAVFRRDGRGWR